MLTAMILASGRGERLKPYTNTCTKAMCYVQGKPMLEHHMLNLVKAGFKHIVINHAYLGEQIRHYFGNGSAWDVKLSYSPEPPGGLETGGGIFHALHLINSEQFLVVNADIFTDYSFATHPLSFSTALAHLVLVPIPNYRLEGDFGLNSDNLVETSKYDYVFSGIAWYNRQFFAQCQPGRYSVTPLLYQKIAEKKVTGELYNGRWIDIGAPSRLEWINQIGFEASHYCLNNPEPSKI